LADLPQQVARTLCHPPPQDLVPIFRDPHEVILDIENRVRARPIFEHSSILAVGGWKLIAWKAMGLDLVMELK
jgi:hypothetical protein